MNLRWGQIGAGLPQTALPEWVKHWGRLNGWQKASAWQRDAGPGGQRTGRAADLGTQRTRASREGAKQRRPSRE
jgi:hypothetical protein